MRTTRAEALARMGAAMARQEAYAAGATSADVAVQEQILAVLRQMSSGFAPTVALPLSPNTLNAAIRVAGIPGVIYIYENQFVITAPAGQVTTVSSPVLAGTVAMLDTETGYASLSATYHSPLIGLTATVDGVQVVGPYSFSSWALTQDGHFGLGQYTFAFQGIVFTVTNNSTADTQITIGSTPAAINLAFYNRVYRPILDAFGWVGLRRAASIAGVTLG